MAQKVIPNSINYADLMPEAIENEIKLIRFTPTATINNAQQNDIIKFILQSSGFLDPYSLYVKFTVQVNTFADKVNQVVPIMISDDAGINSTATVYRPEVKYLDRSAHSFINRLVIRSQGVEIERIEHYDVLCAMLNDLILSQE